MEKFAETASQMIKQGILAMQSQVETVGKELFKKAIESIAKKTKRAITLKKVVAVVKILAFTALIIGVAALSIAATVLTGGAAAPLILQGCSMLLSWLGEFGTPQAGDDVQAGLRLGIPYAANV